MKLSFLPKEFQFFDLFDRLASDAVHAAQCFKDFAQKGTFGIEETAKMRHIEERCDEVTHEIIRKLNRTFITPFDREDIYDLAHELDSVIDIIHSITKRMRLYKLNNIVNEDLIRFADLIEQSVGYLSQAIKGLRNIKQAKQISEWLIEINSVENMGDQLRDEVLGKMFANSTDPMDVIKWKDIFLDAEAVLDQCEDVANIVEGILVKQA